MEGGMIDRWIAEATECDCSKFRTESAHIERHEPNL